MSRKSPSLALLTAITLFSLVNAAMAADRSSTRDTGRSPATQDTGRSPADRGTVRGPANQDTGRKPPSRDIDRKPPSREIERRPPSRVAPKPDIVRKPPNRGVSADATPPSAPIQQRNNFPTNTPNTARPPARMSAPDKDFPAKKDARDDDPKDNKPNPGFTGRMLALGGFEVTGVDRNGPADAAGLQVGDVINSANGIALRTFNDATRAMQNARGVLTLDVTDVNTGAAARRVVRF